MELKDLEENISFVNARDEETGKITQLVIDIKNEKLRDELLPHIAIRDKATNKIKRKYYLPVNAHISVKEGDEVKAGDVLSKIPSEFAKTKDITGGLPRVTELFEARKPKFPAKMAQIDGTIEYGKVQKGARKITIRSFDKNVKPDEHSIPRGAHIIVEDGGKITAGTPLMDGPLNPVDILTVLGEQKLAEYLLKEIQDVYRLQGVEINDKHIEIIIRQMIKWRRVEEVGRHVVHSRPDHRKMEVRGGECPRRGRRRPPGQGQARPAAHLARGAGQRQLPLRRRLPGDDPRPDRRRHRRQGRPPAGHQGERDHGPADPGRHRLLLLPAGRARPGGRQVQDRDEIEAGPRGRGGKTYRGGPSAFCQPGPIPFAIQRSAATTLFTVVWSIMILGKPLPEVRRHDEKVTFWPSWPFRR